MNVKGEKVKSPVFGVGTIVVQDASSITVEFAEKSCRFIYPDAFERFLTAENPDVQANIVLEQQASKSVAAREREAERRQIVEQNATKTPKAKNLDAMFPEAYHVAHLSRQPVLTYQQVEEQFGIKVFGFGRGINVTPSTVVLISSIGRESGKFVYHDQWTPEGDYLYSGEGKTGDQVMAKGNLAIQNAARDGKTIHVFVKFSPKEYYYQGIFELVDYTYEDKRDETGATRKEYQFRLKRVRG